MGKLIIFPGKEKNLEPLEFGPAYLSKDRIKEYLEKEIDLQQDIKDRCIAIGDGYGETLAKGNLQSLIRVLYQLIY